MGVAYWLIGIAVWLWSVSFALYHWGIVGAAVVLLVPPLSLLMPLVGLLSGVWIPLVLEVVGLALLYLSSRNRDQAAD